MDDLKQKTTRIFKGRLAPLCRHVAGQLKLRTGISQILVKYNRISGSVRGVLQGGALAFFLKIVGASIALLLQVILARV